MTTLQDRLREVARLMVPDLMTPLLREAADALDERERRIAVCEQALRAISFAKPDRLDHRLDVLIVERCARKATAALAPREARP